LAVLTEFFNSLSSLWPKKDTRVAALGLVGVEADFIFDAPVCIDQIAPG
jgi:hypothetical protein